MRAGVLFLIFGVVAIVLLLSSIFIVDEREKALVLQFRFRCWVYLVHRMPVTTW